MNRDPELVEAFVFVGSNSTPLGIQNLFKFVGSKKDLELLVSYLGSGKGYLRRFFVRFQLALENRVKKKKAKRERERERWEVGP